MDGRTLKATGNKHSSTMKKLWATPEHRQKVSDAQKKSHKKPAVKRKVLAHLRSPEHIEAVRTGQRKRWQRVREARAAESGTAQNAATN